MLQLVARNMLHRAQICEANVKSWPFFHWSGCHSVNFSLYPSKKRHINVLFKIFSMIRIDKQNLNHKFWGFILILSVQWGQLRTKCPCHFFPSVCHFFICFWSNTVIALDGDYGSDGFILATWTLSPCEAVQLKLMRYIPQHLCIRILTFTVFVFHQSDLSSFLPTYWYHNLKHGKYYS